MAESAPAPAIQRLWGWYLRVLENVGGAAMAVIVVVVTIQVIMRYVFNASLIWAEELCRYILVWITFLLIGLAFHRGELIAVDLLTARLKPVWRYGFKLLVSIPLVIFLGYIVVNGYRFASRMGIQTIPALDFIWSSLTGQEEAEISVFWVYVSVAVGCTLLILHIVVALVAEGRHLRDGHAPEPIHLPPV